MTGPVEEVHFNLWRIGQLHEEDLLGRNSADGIRINIPRQGMKAVQYEAHVGMVGGPHDLPGVTMIEYVLAPRQGLVAYPEASIGGQIPQRGKIRRHAVDAPQRLRMDR